jgi:alginate O-acetyltransferase complex protein AlgJ
MRAPLTVAFLLIIALPLGLNLAGRDGADAEAENRELASFSWTHPGAWFEDHFGFRSTLVRWYGETRLFWFGVSPTPTVLKGRDGFFFYADDKAVEDYVAGDPLTDEALADWYTEVVRVLRRLQPRGIGFVFFVAPDKHAIYPEEMPPEIVRLGMTSRTDQLYGALKDLRHFVIDVRPALLAAKAHERIYHKTDTHWNDRGALVAYRAIIDAARTQRRELYERLVAGRVSEIPPPWSRDDFDPVVRMVEGKDLAGMMGLKRVLREEDMALVPKRPRRAQVVEPPGADPMAEEGRLVTEIPGSTLPRAVIFRDSFVSRLVPFLSEHFSRAVYLWQNDFDAEVIQQEHPDIVIQEIVGRHLYSFIPSPELVPDK